MEIYINASQQHVVWSKKKSQQHVALKWAQDFVK